MATSIAHTPAPERAGGPARGAGSRRAARLVEGCDGPVHPRPVRRQRLVRRLRSARPGTLILISAPAGYGKTSLLRQWAEADPRPFAWVTLDPSHRAPAALAADVIRALTGIGGLPATSVPTEGDDPVGRLGAAVRTAVGPFVLVLDGMQVAAGPASLDALSAVLASLPPGGQLAVATRSEPALPLGRLAAEGGLLRLGMADLALDDAEAGALMRAAGVDAEADDVADVVRRVEGWPAAVSLAALACLEEGGASAMAGFSGADRLAARYVRDELLNGLSDEAVEFLTRTSVLERMSGELCDAMLHRQGSGRMLQELERENLFVVALDRTEQWYRYHRVVRETLRSELRRREPAQVRRLHRRASAWLVEQGDREEAVAHARAAGDLARVGDLIWERLAEDHACGRLATVRRWLAELDDREIAASAKLALGAAWCAAEEGGDLVEHWIAAAERAPDPPGPDGARSIAAGVAPLRGGMASHGVRAMAEYAAAAGRVQPDGPWRPFGLLFEGIAWHLQGDGPRARRLLEESGLRAGHLLPGVHALGLARLALLDVEEGQAERAATLAGRARAIVQAQGLDGYLSTAPVAAASALVLA